MNGLLARFIVLGGVLCALAGCRDKTGTSNSGCRQDSDCGSPTEAYRCETSTGVCHCRTNDACRSSEFCNPSGFCQDRAGCEKNSDCNNDSLFCDTTTGTCLSKGRCTVDLHCSLGQICDVAKSTCVPGCRTNGDCPSSSCLCGDKACVCNGTTPAEIAQCAVGVCDSNFCANESFCAFGQMCGVPPDAGSSLNQCYSDHDSARRPYCDTCQYGAGIQTCGSGKNLCLIDTANPGNYYCGADCSSGQACPRGYGCQDVIVVLQQTQCSRENPYCAPNMNRPCSADKDCDHGGTCVIQPGLTTGFCAGKCAIDEGDAFGYCSCESAEDCVQESCSSAKECTISRQPCNTDEECKTIRCVDYQGAGGCFIGANCAPINGLTCLQVR